MIIDKEVVAGADGAPSIGVPMWGTQTLAQGRNYLAAKRLFDVAVSLAALVLLAPLFAVIALAVLLTDGGPVIYRHNRVGRGGKLIPVLKFRSMRKNADEILKSDPELYKQFLEKYKLDDDPRITRIGGFLRKTSLDELPQLINVLLGHMSMVGPRPVVSDELARYGESQDVYLSLTPGCTGLWQCSGRSDTSYEERVRLDVDYARRASLLLDVRLILLTVPAVLARRGSK